MKKVLITDTNSLVTAGMMHVLKETYDNWEIQTASDLETLRLAISTTSFDLLVLDYMDLADFGLEEVKELKKLNPGTSIFILSHDKDEERIVEFIGGGVDVYLTKACSLKEIQLAIEALLSKRKFYCNRIMEILVRASGHSGQDTHLASTLSEREIKIIEQIAKGKSTSEIASELCLSVHTINAHRKNILRKTNAKNQASLVYKAVSEGIISIG